MRLDSQILGLVACEELDIIKLRAHGGAMAGLNNPTIHKLHTIGTGR
jgi:hypothetical protein